MKLFVAAAILSVVPTFMVGHGLAGDNVGPMFSIGRPTIKVGPTLIYTADDKHRHYIVVAVATPIPHPSQTPPPDVAATPAPAVQRYAGQLLDVERGYVVFSTGDALRLAPDANIVDDDTGLAPTYPIGPGLFAIAVVDQTSGLVTALRTGRTPRQSATPIAEIPRAFVSAASSPQPNPDLAPPAVRYQSKLSAAVQVTVTVFVPPNTPFDADVYVATDTSGWNAQAIKMQRVDGRHYRIVLQLQGGTEFHYLFTRGTWSTVERERSGLQRTARDLVVNGGDALDVASTVYRWADLP